MNKNILFRADSSSTIGTGHIMRDLVLASKYKDANIIFSVQNLEGNINYKIIEFNYKLEILNGNSIDELDSLIKKLDIDLLVIDHYDIDYTFEKELKTKNLKLKILSLDDTYEKHYCDILLNHNISASRDRYKDLVPSFCELRCGSDYTLLREEFYQEKKIKRDKIYDILIAMGGADTANLNIPILKTISQDLKVALITTVANANLEELKEYIQDKNNIRLFINSNEVAKIINQSRLAIITPSVIVNEVYFMDVDFVAIKTADNQDDMAEFLFDNNFVCLEKFNAKEMTSKLKDIINE